MNNERLTRDKMEGNIQRQWAARFEVDGSYVPTFDGNSERTESPVLGVSNVITEGDIFVAQTETAGAQKTPAVPQEQGK